MIRNAVCALLVCLLISGTLAAQQNTNERAAWFTDARFGMFIHWGLYSAAEGFWKGEKIRNDNDYAEWIFYRNRISKEEYLTLLDKINWDETDPEEWVLLAKKSGMKYITFTAKHHDGFALWDSKTGDYHIGNYTNPKRDIVGELAEACRKHDIKLGLYYSHWVDWEHAHGWDHSREVTGLDPENYSIYWQEKVIPQVRELLTNYGDIALFWFDMWVHHSETVVTREQLLQLKSLIRELQPQCLVNSRLGLSIEEDPDIDFKTLGDNELGRFREEFPWQSPATVAHSWGFHAGDTEFKSTTTLLKSLIGNVSLNGNFMLNIGPRANGDVQHEVSQRMLEMGKWLEVNGEAVYGAGAFELDNTLHDWGKITYREMGDKVRLYLHLFNWPLDRKLSLTGIQQKPVRIFLLADKQESPLSFSHDEFYTGITLPVMQPGSYVHVIVLEYDQKPAVNNQLAAVTSEGGYSLTPANSHKTGRSTAPVSKSRGGTVPSYLPIGEPTTLTWNIYVSEPGGKQVDVSYSYQGKSPGGTIRIEAAGAVVEHTPVPTGKTVGEPNSDWVIDDFRSHAAGMIHFPERGIYPITVHFGPAKKEEIKFQWVWIK